MGLIIRDECERSVKNQASKVEQVDFATGSWVACNKQTAKKSRVEHMTGRWRVVSSCHFRDCLTGAKDLRKSLFGKKLCFALRSLYPHYIYPNYSQSVRSSFQRENPRKYTWELEIVIPIIIYTFPCGFFSTPTSPSLYFWEVTSPNT